MLSCVCCSSEKVIRKEQIERDVDVEQMCKVDNKLFAITLYLERGSGPPVPAFFELGSRE